MVESSVTLVVTRIKMQNPSSFNIAPNWVQRHAGKPDT